MLLAALLLAFSSWPGANALRPAEARSTVNDRALFPAHTQQLVDIDHQEFNSSETATPVFDAAQTRVYITLRDGRLRCVVREKDRDRVQWQWQAPGAMLPGPPRDARTHSETLFVPSADGFLTALNRFTGEVRWQTELKEELTTTPSIFVEKLPADASAEQRENQKRILFVMSSEDAVTAVDAKTGKSLWKVRRERPAGFTLRGNARVQVAHGLVYAAYSDGSVVALKPTDGAARWIRNLSGSGDYLDVDGLAAPEDDLWIYAASAKEGVFALDAQTGDVVWNAALPGANHVLVEGSHVYATGKAAIVSLQRRNGKLAWTTKLGGDRFATQPVSVNGLLLVSEDRGALLALDASTGRPRSAFNPGSGFSMPVLAVPGVAFAISNEGMWVELGLLP
ncbi:MAG: PQQ-binding-like beta-propeller repeat protein [Deltaproteobacteria bacterium]|nr:PQQ-binding-like beta-propeller repeat protein [Deltaproteobacteria bacterium]